MRATTVGETFPHGLCCFRLGDDLYGVNLRLVSEINRQIDLTPARTAPEWIAGLVNLRGQIVTVLDLRTRIGLDAAPVGPETRLLVLKTDAELAQGHAEGLTTHPDKIGLLVDAIADVENPTEEQLEPVPPNLEEGFRRLLRGICKTESHAIGILDVGPILATNGEREASASGQVGSI